MSDSRARCRLLVGSDILRGFSGAMAGWRAARPSGVAGGGLGVAFLHMSRVIVGLPLRARCHSLGAAEVGPGLLRSHGAERSAAACRSAA